MTIVTKYSDFGIYRSMFNSVKFIYSCLDEFFCDVWEEAVSYQEVLSRLKELKELIRPEGVFDEVMSSFVSDTHEEMCRLRLLAANGDFEGVKSVAHHLKGGFQLLNAFTLWELCRELEERSDCSLNDKKIAMSRCRKIGEEWLLLKADIVRGIKENKS